jgi:hypothetical protein
VVHLDDEFQESLRQLKDTEGWKYIEDFINKKIQYHEQQLFCCKVDEVLEHRNQREALRSVLLFIDEKSKGEE